jgi:hypothetical protein
MKNPPLTIRSTDKMKGIDTAMTKLLSNIKRVAGPSLRKIAIDIDL